MGSVRLVLQVASGRQCNPYDSLIFWDYSTNRFRVGAFRSLLVRYLYTSPSTSTAPINTSTYSTVANVIMPWGPSSKSCKSLIDRIERNDPTLTDLAILPTKTFGDAELDRLSDILTNATEKLHWKSLSASGHVVSHDALFRFGAAIAAACNSGFGSLSGLAIGNCETRSKGVSMFADGLLKTIEDGVDCTLESLDFSYKGMEEAGFVALSRLTERCASIQKVDVSRNDLCGGGRYTDFPSLLFPKVQELDLTSCNLDPDLATFVMKRLFDKTSITPRTLRLANNNFPQLPLFRNLAEMEVPIDGIYASNCELADGALIGCDTSTAETVSKHARVLDLSNNKLTEKGLTPLVKSLIMGPQSPWKMLTEINLAGNQIGATGILLLSGAMNSRRQVSQITVLDASETGCTVEGAIRLISSVPNLLNVRLFNNNLGSNGFLAMANARCFELSTIETLDLSGNGASQEAVVALLEMLLDVVRGAGCSLKTLVIGGNEGGPDVERVIEQIQRIRPDLDIARDKRTRN